MEKSARLAARVVPEEFEDWKKAAKAEGMSLAAWIRMLANDRLVVLKARNL